MCGIVGYIGSLDAVSVLLEGLHRLEYRGYDSSGIAVISDGDILCKKSTGKLSALRELLDKEPVSGTCGIGHTRWATHGQPSLTNSHPHSDASGEIFLVHNGIIENFHEIKDVLIEEGHQFKSQTDTEVLAHLVGRYYKGDLAQAVRSALKEVEGAYAIGVVCRKQPGVLVAARSGSPLVIGLGEGENFIASDVPAILSRTRRVVYLGDHQVAAITAEGVQITDLDGAPLESSVHTVDWDANSAEKSGYAHFMLKEIQEQPRVISDTLRGRFGATGEIRLDEMTLENEFLKGIRKVVITACGTAYHAGMVGKYLLEKFARIPVEVDLASEFRYRNPILDETTLVMTVTQSGETADTLAALKEARRLGSKVLSICNVVGSSIARESDAVIYQHAGPEIGVASTKAYTSQVTCFVLLALYMGRLRDTISAEEAEKVCDELRALPPLVRKALDNQDAINRCAEKYYQAHSALYLGRGVNFPSALEGALKLKEISYIHAEGYASGEMKHGPIALVDPGLPVICICVKCDIYDKVISNIQEIMARSGRVIAIASAGDENIQRHAEDVVFIPEAPEYLTPILAAGPLQMLAYTMAVRRGCDVDQPRNLAKSVTVE